MAYIDNVTHHTVIVLSESIDLSSPWLQFKVGHVPEQSVKPSFRDTMHILNKLHNYNVSLDCSAIWRKYGIITVLFIATEMKDLYNYDSPGLNQWLGWYFQLC